jgi:hypothetical protein
METNLMDSLQKFLKYLNREPSPESITPTPDKRAHTVTISHVEMTLDELYFGRWSTKNFQWSQIGNEIMGSITLEVMHPITNECITRTGSASIVIMVDKAPDNLTSVERNRWALNPDNKKSNALDLAAGKLKSECVKNAALSLGKIFGRDLNRQIVDMYQPYKLQLPEATMKKIENDIKLGVDEFEIRNGIEQLGDLITEPQKQHIFALLNNRNNE